MAKHKQSLQHSSRAKRTHRAAEHFPWSRRTKRRIRLGQAAGYYSTTFNLWRPTNARRHALQTGGYEHTTTVSD